MGIYDENKYSYPTMKVSIKQLKLPLAMLAAIIVVALLAFSLNEALKPRPLAVLLAPNPLDLALHSGTSAMLDVGIFNTFPSTVSSVVVKVEEVGSSALIIFPASRRIDSMAPATDRKLDSFVIRPNPGKEIQSGSYKIMVSVSFDGQKVDSRELVLVIKAV